MLDSEKYGNEPDFSTLFSEIIGAEVERDAGITQFDGRMDDAAEQFKQLMARKGIKGGFDEGIAGHYEEAVNAEWEHAGEVATVSGRIYLANAEYEHLVPESWGEQELSESGMAYYFVEDAKVRSHGVEIVPIYNEEVDEDGDLVNGTDEDEATDVRMGYVFSLADDEFERELFSSFPGELSKHVYETPTIAEAEERLKRRWPEALASIDSVLKEGASIQGLQHRLGFITRRLQTELQDREFRMYVTPYINDRIAFRPGLPYALTVKNELQLVNVDDPETAYDEVDKERIMLNEPMVIMAYDPIVGFSPDARGEGIAAHVAAASLSGNEANGPEIFAVQAQNIEQILPLFASRSLAERAIVGAHLSEQLGDELLPYRWLIDKINQPAQASFAVKPERISKFENGVPKYYLEIEKTLNWMRELGAMVAEQNRTIYSTYEDAQMAAREFIAQYIKPHANERFSGRTEFRFSGQGVSVPNVEQVGGQKEGEDGKPEGLYIAYALDPETIRHRLGDDEVETGVPVDIIAGARGHQDHEGNVVGYSALPMLVADIDHNIQPIAAWEGVVVLESIMQKRMLVAIDGSSRMTHEGLEKFNAIREAMKALKQEHARHPITGKLERLTRALAGADERTFKDLGQSKLMRAIGTDIVSMYESNIDTSRAMTALDEILSSRAVQVDGAVYADAEDEDSERAEVPKDAVGNMAFKVLSVGNDIFDHQPLFTMRDAAGAVYYARFDSIRTMRF